LKDYDWEQTDWSHLNCDFRKLSSPLHRLTGDLERAINVFEFRSRSIKILAAVNELMLWQNVVFGNIDARRVGRFIGVGEFL